jgi:hypothetical protein
MTRRIYLMVVAALFAGNIAVGQEHKIKRLDLPAAVEKTVTAQSEGATIRGFSTEKEHGQILYEAALTVAGLTKDILIDAKGEVVEVEEEVVFDQLPAPVKTGLLAKAAKGQIRKVESLTKHDKLVAYEAQVVTNGKRSEIQVGPDGKPLSHEE